MKRKMSAGLTSVSIPIFAQDTSSTAGAGLSGLTSGTSGLVAEYRRQGQSSWTAITLGAGTLGTWSSGGIVADGALGGAYEFGVPDAALATGARWAAIRLRGAANMLPVLIEVELDAVNYQDAVHFGLSALPNAAAAASGGLPTVDAGNAVKLQAGTAAGQLDFTAGVVKANATQWLGGTIPAVNVTGVPRVDVVDWLGSAPNALASGRVDASVGAYPGNTAQTGDAYARIGAAGAGLTALGDTRLANLDAAVSTRSTFAGGAVASVAGNVGGNVTGSVGSVAAGGIAATSFAAGAINAAAVAADAITSAELATSAVAEIVTAVFSEAIPGTYAAGSAADRLNAAGSAGDPWGTALPGAYGPGTAGNIVGGRLDVAVSTRSTYDGTDTAGTTTLLTRIPGTVQPQAGDAYARLGPNGAGLTALGDARLANLDATITSRMDASALPANFAALAITGGGAVTVGVIADKAGYSLAAAGLDAVVVEPAAGSLPAVNARQALALVMDAAGSGVLAGAATDEITVKNPAGTATRLVVVADSNGNRTSIDLMPPI